MHYHGTPISPRDALLTLAGRAFCVSHARPQDVEVCHRIGQSVLLDNGAFSAWRRGAPTDWAAYYAWCDRWLDCPTTWAIIPDVIGGGEDAQDALLRQWPHGGRGAPVWHLDESLPRLLRLLEAWPRVCLGSASIYAVVGSDAWHRRMVEAWNAIARVFGRRTPWVHMLRGMQAATWPYPFASLDSTDIARNHNRPHNAAAAMAQRWDAGQCPRSWQLRPEQACLFGGAA
jgi:hypothetical protein